MSGREANTRTYDPAQENSEIARLNDALRRHERGGRLLATHGVMALPKGSLPVILGLIRDFDDFTRDNDPRSEHDFGVVEWSGQKLFWKIDCYDRDLRYASPDPADPSITTRVLTVMLASEY